MKTDNMLFEYNPTVKPGTVSPRCHFVDDGNIRMVFSYDMHLYTYNLADRSAERVVWVQVYETKLATYKQIAEAIGKGVRTINGWVSLYRKNDMARLVDAPRSGAPVKVTASVIKRIVRLREKNMKTQEIAQACNISVSSVRNVLRERKINNDRKQGKLALTEVDEDVTVEEPEIKKQEAINNVKTETVPSDAIEHSIAAYTDKTEDILAKDRSEDRIFAAKGLIQDADRFSVISSMQSGQAHLWPLYFFLRIPVLKLA